MLTKGGVGANLIWRSALGVAMKRGTIKVLATNAAIVGVGVAGATIAYAQGSQSHTSNGVTHGCPFDAGCVSGDDNNRVGYNLKLTYGHLVGSKIGIYRDPSGDGGRYPQDLDAIGTSDNLRLLEVEYDTNPYDECSWATYHYNNTPSMNFNWHWTHDAPYPCQ